MARLFSRPIIAISIMKKAVVDGTVYCCFFLNDILHSGKMVLKWMDEFFYDPKQEKREERRSQFRKIDQWGVL
eukprot:3876038-Ditylum_brightwellii.AAC.1